MQYSNVVMNSNSICLIIIVIQDRKKRKIITNKQQLIKGLRRKIFLLTYMFYLCYYRSDININILAFQDLEKYCI